ncbi:cyclin-dependent kinases regulatory subunit-like [Penaeus monodon]|uniref:cyclin-dependent kinases regulatory subunit-like n=1 Tax=Penaeus monodon TaxID=6687 RepID=UPI0018A7C8AC|nr:cyclin-dependent kinases regulatory subunit-like [Penaeus monodon]
MPHRIYYSDKYYDEKFEYRPNCSHLVHPTEPHILLFRRPITTPPPKMDEDEDEEEEEEQQ